MSIIAETTCLERGDLKIRSRVEKTFRSLTFALFGWPKEEILHAWLGFVGKVIEHHFLFAGENDR